MRHRLRDVLRAWRGQPVHGSFPWSSRDDFAWTELGNRFGSIRVDVETLERRPS